MKTIIVTGLATLTTIGMFAARAYQRARECEYIRKDKRMRASLSEKQIDKMLMDSFPASDAPSTY